MVDTFEINEFSQRTEEILAQMQDSPEGIILKSGQTPKAAILPYRYYEEYLVWRSGQEKRQAWLDELQRIADEVSQRAGLSEEEAADLAERSYRETLGG